MSERCQSCGLSIVSKSEQTFSNVDPYCHCTRLFNPEPPTCECRYPQSCEKCWPYVIKAPLSEELQIKAYSVDGQGMRKVIEYAAYEKLEKELAETKSKYQSSLGDAACALIDLNDERAKSAALIELLKSLNVQAIVNGQSGQDAVTERINSALKKWNDT